MIKLVGLKEKTSAIFRIDPLFSFSLSGLIMASSSSRDGGSTCDNSWVGKETLGVAFELLFRFLGLPASKDQFFAFFAIQRGLNKDEGLNWVCFRQHKALFEVFSSEALKFQDKFFLVRPRTEAVLTSVLKMLKRPHADAAVVPARVPRFHFCWSRYHLKHESTMYRYSYDQSKPDELCPNHLVFRHFLQIKGDC